MPTGNLKKAPVGYFTGAFFLTTKESVMDYEYDDDLENVAVLSEN